MTIASDSQDHPETDSSEAQYRQELVAAMHTMRQLNLNVGTAGNASVRYGNGMLISPSGVAPANLEGDDIVYVPGASDPDSTEWANARSPSRPSSEWRLHRAVLDARPDLGAVVHCHSRYATVIACARKPIPAVHYLVGLCGASQVPVTPYARFGTAELAHFAAEALASCDACLLANHGLIAAGGTVVQALALAEEIEEQAALYWHTLAIGGATVLGETEMARVLGALDVYRTPNPTKDD